MHFSNFGSLKSTEIVYGQYRGYWTGHFSNFGSLKSTEMEAVALRRVGKDRFQQFRLVEEH